MKSLWPKRFLPLIQSVKEAEGFPGFVKLFTEIADRKDWPKLRGWLSDFFLSAEEIKIPPPRT
jgi:hypothetical protein